MREYTAQHCNGMPNWADVPAVNIDQKLHPTDANVTAQAQLCYDEHALYVRLSAQENPIRAELTGKLDEICEDSCLEFFFSPVPGDRRYFNIECNPNGALYLGMGSDAHNPARVGQYCMDACKLACEIFGHVCTFENRQPIFHKL